MQLEKKTINMLWIIGCLQCIVSLVSAQPPVGEKLQDPGSALLTNEVYNTGVNLPAEPATTADVTNNVFSLTANSDGAKYMGSNTNPQAESAQASMNNALSFSTANGISNAGDGISNAGDGISNAVNGVPLTVRLFNAIVPSSQDTNSQVGSGSNSISKVSSTQGSGDTGILTDSNRNANFNQQASTTSGRIYSPGFIATLASPYRPGRVMFPPSTMRYAMRSSNNRPNGMNMMLRPTGKPSMATVANLPKRGSFNTFQRPSGMMLPFTIPRSAPSFTSSQMHFPPQLPTRYVPSVSDPVMPPAMFQTPLYSPPEQSFSITPFVGPSGGFSSAPFQQPSTFISAEPTFFSAPATFAGNLPSVPRPSRNSLSFPPNITPFGGPSFRSRTFSNEPATSFNVLPPIILNPQSTTGMQSPPPPVRATAFRRYPTTMDQIPTVIPISPPLPLRSSIPIAFATTPSIPAPNVAPFSFQMRPERPPNFGIGMSPPFPTPVGGVFQHRFGGVGAGGPDAAAAAAAGAQGFTANNGVFSVGLPLAQPPSLMQRFNNFIRPSTSSIQAF